MGEATEIKLEDGPLESPFAKASFMLKIAFCDAYFKGKAPSLLSLSPILKLQFCRILHGSTSWAPTSSEWSYNSYDPCK